MSSNYRICSSESYCRTQTDKVCDFIADGVVDFFTERDRNALISADVVLSKNLLMVCGELLASQDAIEEAKVILPYQIKERLFNVYPHDFDWAQAKKFLDLKPIVGQKLSNCKRAGGLIDQGLIVGCACDETEELAPLPSVLAHKMTRKLDELKGRGLIHFGNDGLCQVHINYEGLIPKNIESIVFSLQQQANTPLEELRKTVESWVVKEIVPPHLLNQCRIEINPGGTIDWGGPKDSTGFSGRHIAADSYGGGCPFYSQLSGRSALCISRSGSYMARCIAKGVVLAGLACRCQVQLSYAQGSAQPVGVQVDLQGTELGALTGLELAGALQEGFDLSPQGICSYLKLNQPIFDQLSNYGHFGQESPLFSWETDGVQKISDFFENL